MGILDGYYFSPETYGGVNAGLLSRLPEWMLPQGQGQGFPDQIPGNAAPAAGDQTPGLLERLLGGTGAGGPPQGSNETVGQFGGPSEPGASPPSAFAGMFASAQRPAQGESANPAVPPAIAQAPMRAPAQSPDRLGAALGSFTGSPTLLGGLANALGGAITGRRVDAQGITEAALTKQGLSPELARAAVANPTIMSAVVPSLFGQKYQLEKLKGVAGEETPYIFDPLRGQLKPIPQNGGMAGVPNGIQALAPGVASLNPAATGDAYLAQFSPEVQAIVKAHLNGDVMPTGNPRLAGLMPLAKTVATTYAQQMGIPFSDDLYARKRKMGTDLASSSNSSMGGIISNGMSAFEHLGTLADKLANLGNYSGPNLPGGAIAGQAGNYIGSTLLPRAETKDKIGAATTAAMKYGQESTKFYAGSGGGEGERLAALKNLDPNVVTGAQQAGFLETEKELMIGRLRKKEEQIRELYGDRIPTDVQRKLDAITEGLKPTLAKIDENIQKLRGQGAATAKTEAPSAPQITEGATATGPNGHKIVVMGGRWVDVQTGKPL